MNEKQDEQPLLSAEEAAFIAALAEIHTPPPLDAVRRASLDAELRDRIAAARGPALARPAFATAVVALMVGLALTWRGFESPPQAGDGSGGLAVHAVSSTDWEMELFDPGSFGAVDATEDLDDLPDDYAAIAGILLDG